MGNFKMKVMICPKRLRNFKYVFLFFFSLFLLWPLFSFNQVHAEWIPDSEVTVVGKASERSRQLLFWFFSHPSLDNSPTIRLMWATSRNIALVFLILIIVGFGLQLILAKEKAKLQSFFPKLMGMIVFCVFSYVLVLGLIQLSEVTMRFFIERVAGQNLFNITFSGGNVEANYTNFIGYRENNPVNLESAKTGLFLVKTTTLTYNVIFIILVIRKVALWLMLILAPFLPLLFAFALVKNVGWIWIGVFFQWLFYGPLFSIFLAGLVKIWEGGIPFAFDFSRAGKSEGQIYLTAINILYGGPAQTLSPKNSANYVDTYAEYIIGLLMLWVVTLLPWLLLRNFRDYCCEVFKGLEATTMNLYNRLIPGTTSGPSGVGRIKLELPFRRQIERAIPTGISAFEKEQVTKMKTEEILSTMGLRVAKLADISRLDINAAERKAAGQKLDYLKMPSRVADISQRRQYSVFNQELSSRATRGDVIAERTLATDSKMPAVSMVRLTPRPFRTVEGVLTKGSVQKTAGVTMAVRTVSIEDYEEVKKMWLNNYRESEIPVSDKIQSREDWLKDEVAKISDTVELLSSKDEEKKKLGLERVGSILPFLYLGGFNEEQTLVYLKAKLEAAKQASVDLTRTKEETAAKTIESEEGFVSIKRAEEREKVNEERLEEAVELKKTQGKTEEILDALGLKISNLADISRLDMNVGERKTLDQKLESLGQKPQEVKTGEEKIESKETSTTSGKTTATKAVSFEDYEEVRRMWFNNYRNGQVEVSQTTKNREDWLKEEVAKISDTVELLSTKDEQKKKAGLARVGGILPFLYLGGFSEEQMLAYLKAKLEAAKQVQSELDFSKEKAGDALKEEESLVKLIKSEKKEKTSELKPKDKQAAEEMLK